MNIEFKEAIFGNNKFLGFIIIENNTFFLLLFIIKHVIYYCVKTLTFGLTLFVM